MNRPGRAIGPLQSRRSSQVFHSEQDSIFFVLLIDRSVIADRGGAPVEIEWNEGMLQFSAWIVPKGAENKKLAMEFIDFTHQPKLEAAYAEFVGYPGVNKKTYEMVKPEFAPNLPTYPENLEKQIVVDYKWWYKHKKEVQERWDEWIMK